MKRNFRRILFVLGGLVTLLFVASVGIMLFFGRSALPTPPNPNGYEDLTKAGHAVSGNLDSLAETNLHALRAILATNAEVLHLLRVGLSRQCSAPADPATANFRDLIALKLLAKLLNAEGRLAELENRTADAARSYLDIMQLGTKVSHGRKT